jgi:hypothetical protein
LKKSKNGRQLERKDEERESEGNREREGESEDPHGHQQSPTTILNPSCGEITLRMMITTITFNNISY